MILILKLYIVMRCDQTVTNFLKMECLNFLFGCLCTAQKRQKLGNCIHRIKFTIFITFMLPKVDFIYGF